ncbi:hypothetical protein RvY_06858 [Ramazzottius varieornatus]|uniref:F-box domain-containing protein n=1 Tax=Ramazzottius varieornatus TaxID=947166 RepID=A0A1D1V030_RAMVA|nr:hypothetical protein RvY_06858 [Ramazzottius varieornatus]
MDKEAEKSISALDILNSLERDELISIIQRTAKEKAIFTIELQDGQSRLRRAENRNKILQQNLATLEDDLHALAEEKNWWKEKVTSRSCTCGLFSTTINDLPGELLLNIFQHVDVTEHGILRTVSKTWNKTLKSKIMKRNVFLHLRRIPIRRYDVEYCATVAQRARRLLSPFMTKNLTLEVNYNHPDASFVPVIIENSLQCTSDVLSYCENLKALVLIGYEFPVQFLSGLKEWCPKLKQMSLVRTIVHVPAPIDWQIRPPDTRAAIIDVSVPTEKYSLDTLLDKIDPYITDGDLETYANRLESYEWAKQDDEWLSNKRDTILTYLKKWEPACKDIKDLKLEDAQWRTYRNLSLCEVMSIMRFQV